MPDTTRRALGLYLILNALFALSLLLPAAALLNHWLPIDGFSNERFLLLWGGLTGLSLLLTAISIPAIARWLARKDVEREQKRLQKRKS
jgi:hypothetical protein